MQSKKNIRNCDQAPATHQSHIIKDVNIGPFYSSDAIGLTFAADQQFLENPSVIDAVWKLETDESAPISLMSTLGLQARNFQIMPQISLNKVSQERIQDFFGQPRLDLVLSNYIKMTITPFSDLIASIEFWVRAGDWVQGRICVTNHGETNVEAGARIASRLIALQGSSELKPTRQGFQTYLRGQSGSLTVHLGMEGNSKTVLSPNLALEQSKHLSPGQTLQTAWQCEIQKNGGDIHNGSRSFPVNWDGEIARLQVANQTRMLQISTPETNWDAVFYSNQNQAFQLLRKNSQGHISPDKSRSIHSAFTPENPPARSGVSALELWQLTTSLLPAQTDLAAQLLADHLATASATLASNPHHALPFPCLCDLAWRVHQQYQQKEYLLEIYPTLKALCFAWFSPEHDRDQDGIPEWTSSEQCGLTTLNTFNLLDENHMATRISFTEQLNLAALLEIELSELCKIAQIAEDTSAVTQIENHLVNLDAFSRSIQNNGYQTGCLDRKSHHWHPGEVLFQGELKTFGTKSIYLRRPVRLNLRFKPALQLKKPPVFYLHGENVEGEQVAEAVEPDSLLWLPGSFFYTTNQIYARIDNISDLQINECHMQIHQADLGCCDMGMLLSAPAQNESAETETGKPLSVESALATTTFGLPEDLDLNNDKKVVNLSWNLLVLANLIRKDEVNVAFRLLSQLQQAQINLLRLEHNNTDRWSSQNGRMLGLRNTIGGLVPVNLVLELAGIRILNENKVVLRGQNPFPWAFSVQYRGLKVTREGKNATICFPDGTIHHHFGSAQKTFSNDVVETVIS